MGAPNNAVPLGFTDWLKKDGKTKMTEAEARRSLPGVTCECGFRGLVGDLLEDPDDLNPRSTMWCPQCGMAGGWLYD